MNISCFKRTYILYILILCSSYILFQYGKIPYIILANRFLTKTPLPYYLRFMNETNQTQIALYYRHATSARNSSYPYISGDTFRAFADYVYDETRQDDLTSVKYGDVVFVKSDVTSQFFSSAFHSIQNPFVLVTHNSDYGPPGKLSGYLSNEKILRWYTSNPSERNSSKLTPIPIGLANTRWRHGNLTEVIYAIKHYRKPWSQRSSLLYVNLNIDTNTMQRKIAVSQALKIDNVQIIKQRVSFETYLQQIGNAKFVLSPPGGGIDCHRTWEALLMGAVPIMYTSTLDPLFSSTRSIIIDDWSKVTQQFLLSFNFSLNDHVTPDISYAGYWREMVFQHKK